MTADKQKPLEVKVDVEVRYAETDQMGVVHHANYLVWCELARTRLCARTGYHYRDIEAMGYQLMVTAANLNYRLPARYGDLIEVACQLEGLSSRGLTFSYRLSHEQRLLVRGTTDHVWFSVAKGRVCRIPGELEAPFLTLLG
jgi:acyl-CoA thioester hydrolase